MSKNTTTTTTTDGEEYLAAAVAAVLKQEALEGQAATALPVAMIATALAVEATSARQVSARYKEAGVGAASRQSVATYCLGAAFLALEGDPDGDHGDDALAAVAIRFALNAAIARGVSQPTIAKEIARSANRDEAMGRILALKPQPKSKPEPEVTPEGEGEADGEPTPDQGRTPWQDRVQALVAQAMLEGATPDEVRAVVAAALA